MGQIRLSDREVQLMLHLTRTQEPSLENVALPWAMLRGLRELIACDELSVCDHDTPRRRSVGVQALPGLEADVPQEVFWGNYWECLDCSYPDRTGDVTSVTMISDFYSTREFHNTGMYIEHDSVYGVEHEMMLCLPAGPGRTIRVLLARGAGLAFTERDRAVLSLLRPHLYMAYLAQQRHRADKNVLTPRQREVLQYVATGYSNRQIARRMKIVESTVCKHLENIFKRLDVNSRTAAVAYLTLPPLRGGD